MEDELIELFYKQPVRVPKTTGFPSLDATYLHNMCAYVAKCKVYDPWTNQDLEPDEKLMREVEEGVGVYEAMVDDFRRQVATQIGFAHVKGKTFKWSDNPHLAKGVKKKYFKDTHRQSLTSDIDYTKLSGKDLIDAEFEVR